MRAGRRNLSGIPRPDYNARRVTEATDSRGRSSKRTYEAFIAERCTWQPYVGNDLKLLEDGYNASEVWQVWTDTELKTAQQNTTSLSDEIEKNGIWYKVIKSRPWQNGVLNNYELTVVRIDEVLNG